MTPHEAARLMHERALMLIDFAENLRRSQSLHMTHEELLYWCLVIMNLYAESLWNMGDMLESLGSRFDFTVDALSPNDIVTDPDANAALALDEPPFEKEFFMDQRDLNEP
jgi:hypothetical protein